MADTVQVGCDLTANLSACWGEEGTTAWESLSTDQQDIVSLLAVSTLNSLTAGIVANCPVTVRPCSSRCCVPGYTEYGPGWYPVNVGNGMWLNACGCRNTCACDRTKALTLPAPTAEVTEVKIDGVALLPADYRLEQGRWLFRTDGELWPTTQDLNLPDTEVDTFSVTLRPGWDLGPFGEAALGRLVCEYSKGMCGRKCALPKNVTQVVRSGVVMEITPGLFGSGLTGIREVDIYIESINPYHLKSIPSVYSPDVG